MQVYFEWSPPVPLKNYARARLECRLLASSTFRKRRNLSGRLQKLQNLRARIIYYTYSDYSIRSADILDTLGWDTLEQKRTKQLAISVFKARNNFHPTRLKSMFEPTSNIHSYNLRGNSNNIFIPRPRTEAAK